MKKSDLEAAFDHQLRVLAPELPKPEPEFRFHPPRRWRIDRAWPVHQVAVELEGGAWGKRIKCHNCHKYVRAMKGDGSPGRELRLSGAHGGSAFQRNIEKYNTLDAEGWILLRYTNENVIGNPFPMILQIKDAIESRSYRVPTIENLTARQLDVLYLVAAGFKTSEIAERLGTKEGAVSKYIQIICEKLLVKNRPAAVAKGIAWGMVELGKIPWTGDASDEGLFP